MTLVTRMKSIGSPLILAVRAVNKTISVLYDDQASERLPLPQFCVLGLLIERGPQSQTEIWRGAFTDSSTMGIMLQTMKVSGLIACCRNEDNRRANIITITPRGREQYFGAKKIIDGIEKMMLAELPASQRGLILRMMRQIANVGVDARSQEG